MAPSILQAPGTLYFLSGASRPNWRDYCRTGAGGVIVTPEIRYSPDNVAGYPRWAADNGCFSQAERFDLSRFYEWLGRMAQLRSTCLFAVAPDVVGDASATIARSSQVLPKIRNLGFPAAFVGQDGLTIESAPWDDFDVYFIGGSTEWKMGYDAQRIAREAAHRGKWVHMGRCNSLKRMLYARAIGCRSVDGTYIAFRGDRGADDIARWLGVVNGPLQGVLPW